MKPENNGSRCPKCGAEAHATADPSRDVCINIEAHGQPFFWNRTRPREEFPEPPVSPLVEKQLSACNCEG